MAEVQQVNISCECYHRHGLLYVLRPWAWGRPCRRCARMMDRNVVVVPTSGAAVAVSPRQSPMMVSTTTTTMTPQPQVMTVTPAQTTGYPTVLPPRYDVVAAK